MLIPRTIQDDMTETLKTGQKIVVIYGARQTGKTTLAKKVIEELGQKTLDKISIDHEFMERIQKELGDKVGKILTKASLECDSIILEAKKKADKILKGYSGEIVVKHNIKYGIKEKK